MEGFKAQKSEPPTSEKNEDVFLVLNVNLFCNLGLENWQFSLKVFVPNFKIFFKMLIRPLYVKRFKSSDQFVFSTVDCYRF